MKMDRLPTRPSVRSCLLLTGLVAGYYAINNLSLFSFLDYSVYHIVIKPVYWLNVIYMVWRLPRTGPVSKLRLRDSIYFWAILHGIIYVAVWFAAGFLDGFGRSPYDQTPLGIIINIIVIGTMLVGKELVRNHLVSNLAGKENYLVFIFITFFFTLESFDINRYTGFTDLEGAVQFLAEFFIPCFSRNLMATYLAYIGGPIASISYLGIYSMALYLSPVLPGLKWITAALVGILCPVFSMMGVQSMYARKSRQIKKNNEKKESPLGWACTSIVSIGIIWFAIGVFPVYPSVIATGSMEPAIKPGDLILVRKLGDREVREGDVIQFRRDDILISHRVVKIIEDDAGTRYRTRGDNNSAEDLRPVKPEEVKGRIIYVLPKIGWPTLLLKGGVNNAGNVEDVEF